MRMGSAKHMLWKNALSAWIPSNLSIFLHFLMLLVLSLCLPVAGPQDGIPAARIVALIRVTVSSVDLALILTIMCGLLCSSTTYMGESLGA
jgi:hypothetical protein